MFLSYLWKTLKLIVSVTLTILFVRTLVIEPGRVNGVSMEPTYFDDQLFFINKFQLIFSKPRRGQIVQCRKPNADTLLIKRIIGLPGETVHVRDNQVYVTGTDGKTFQLLEPYLGPGVVTQMLDKKPFDFPTLRADEYFVLGDNRRESGDSRTFGPFRRDLILGLVITTF